MLIVPRGGVPFPVDTETHEAVDVDGTGLVKVIW